MNGIWEEIRDAIRGNEKDYTQGSIKRAIVLLSIPMVLEMAMESIFAIVDIYFVSSLGPEAVAVVGITESIMTLCYALGIGLSMATTAVVARRIGEKRFKDATNSGIQAIIIALLMSLPMMIGGLFFSETVLRLMNASEAAIAMGAKYTSTMMIGNVIIMLLFVINAIFRSAGDAAIAMRVLFLANTVNIILDPCLILGLGPFPELGVYGAAVATNIGRGIGVLAQLFILIKGTDKIKLAVKEIAVDLAIIKKIIR
ncbi:MAG: MATE family efflux transporter, partial [Bacteroidetes bacterium]|nr:MATE family efflux transporter [Bacteroidota bacterium]